jgi:hypothetical protein
MSSVLIFYGGRRVQHLSYYGDWFAALCTHPGFAVTVVDTSTTTSLAYGLVRARRRSYDLIVFPYSFFYENTGNRRRAILAFARGLHGTKVFFLENEYRLMRDKLAYAVAVGADYVTTQLPKDVADRAYCAFFAPSRIIPLPHGLSALDTRAEAPFDDSARPVDIGFRGTSFAYSLGHRDREMLLEFFIGHSQQLGLRVDIDGERPVMPAEWRRFLRACKGVVGHESGTDFFEINDDTRERIGEYQTANPNATFEEIHRIFFKDYPDPLSGRALSSRHFDAIGAKTCQILFPGRFNDLLSADQHYLALARDFSNVDDVLRRFRDVGVRRSMVENTYAYARDAHTLAHRIAELVRWIGL